MIQQVIENLTYGIEFSKIIFVVRQEYCDKYHLDKTLTLLSPVRPEIIRLRADTQGALCSALLAIEHINADVPLLISNADQIFEFGIANQVAIFLSSELAAACLTMTSVHPRWSYVRADAQFNVREAAEKRPISKHAIAGLYMYRSGAEFVKFGMSSIQHGASVDGLYYIAPVFNEYLLAGKAVGHYPIPNDQYHTFYSPQKIEEFDSRMGRGR